ncbi:alpha/beta fold hydrolase [Streptomyces triticagri]|uniref:Alpha/beta fold hydrolase n=1 Tax=Streptomyces triticagri TaxID=2293568 RepID=A0A372M5D8_9ACTN|nr:alpha/beta fold hydrolase [Streptomyces triticagri]RFU85673.1 alpha/beta fold hydrolase [Streptomyces triticagri]
MSATAFLSIDTPHGPETVSVAYHREGAGEPLLLLHGIGHHWQAWEPVLRILAAERDVIAVDLPGFGESPALPAAVPYGLPEVSAVLGAFCAELGLDRPHVAGNSLGGMLSLEMARRKLVRSATVLSPGGFWTPGERRYAFATLLAMRHGARLLPVPVIERLSRTAAGRTALTGTIYARPWRRSPEAVVGETLALRNATGFDLTLAAGREGAGAATAEDVPDVPVTVAWGERDRLLPRRQGVRAKHVVPSARLIRLPGCGHVPMNDDPALVARVLLDATAAAPLAIPAGERA